GSLRQAIADAADGDTIEFAVTTPAVILLESELVVGANVTIAGPGVDALTIDGQDASRVFLVSPFATVTIADLTLTGGNGGTEGGGCIYNQGGTLELSRVVVHGC